MSRLLMSADGNVWCAGRGSPPGSNAAYTAKRRDSVNNFSLVLLGIILFATYPVYCYAIWRWLADNQQRPAGVEPRMALSDLIEATHPPDRRRGIDDGIIAPPGKYGGFDR